MGNILLVVSILLFLASLGMLVYINASFKKTYKQANDEVINEFNRLI